MRSIQEKHALIHVKYLLNGTSANVGIVWIQLFDDKTNRPQVGSLEKPFYFFKPE
jgi:hypothetical protein